MKTISKLAAIALVAAFVVVAPQTKAATVAELQAMIAQLTAQISNLSGTTAPAAHTFTTNLTVGSTGAEVSALQNFLAAKGFLTATARGNFGPLTKKALADYQTSKGITPAAGYFGPKTQASVNGDSAVVTTTPGTTTTTSGATLDGTDGSLTASQSSYVSSGVQLKKGDTKDILAVRLKATSGPVTVTRADVHLNLRPWLVFSQLTLKDSSGKVIATKNLSGASDATEITVGSDYLVRFDNVNYTVKPGSDVDMVVGGTVLAATDKIANGQIVNVTFGSNGIRTTNGKDYTDSVSTADLNGQVSSPTATQQSGSGVNSFTLSSTGSVADIYARVSPSSPTTRQQVVSLTQTTSDVVLGIFSLKSANNSSTLNTLNVAINGLGATPSQSLSNIRLYDGSQSYGGTLSGTTTTFSNLNIALSQDVWKDFTVKADVAQAQNGTASTSLTANTSNIVVTDANYNTATVEPSTAASNNVTFTTNAISVVNASAQNSGAIIQNNNTVGYNVAYQFGLTNTSNNDLFVSTSTAAFVGTSTTGTVGSSTLATIQTVSPSTLSGDTSAAYVIPAGATRTFTITGAIRGATGQSGVNLKVVQINYGTTSAAVNTQNITFGLENLNTTANF